MKYFLLSTSVILLISSFTFKFKNDEGKELYETYCISCHQYEKQDNMVAPPVFALKDHYVRAYSDKGELKQAMISFIVKPREKNAHMPGAIRKFGLMPPMPLPEEDLSAIVDYIVDTEFKKPEWYDQHYKEEHGSN